jgi:hypothetical protein
MQLMCLEMRRSVYSAFNNIQLRSWHNIYLHHLLLSYKMLTAILGKELRNANVVFWTEYILYQANSHTSKLLARVFSIFTNMSTK